MSKKTAAEAKRDPRAMFARIRQEHKNTERLNDNDLLQSDTVTVKDVTKRILELKKLRRTLTAEKPHTALVVVIENLNIRIMALELFKAELQSAEDEEHKHDSGPKKPSGA